MCARHLFHTLWSKAVGTPEYVKKEWQALEAFVLGGSVCLCGRVDAFPSETAVLMKSQEENENRRRAAVRLEEYAANVLKFQADGLYEDVRLLTQYVLSRGE